MQPCGVWVSYTITRMFGGLSSVIVSLCEWMDWMGRIRQWIAVESSVNQCRGKAQSWREGRLPIGMEGPGKLRVTGEPFRNLKFRLDLVHNFTDLA